MIESDPHETDQRDSMQWISQSPEETALLGLLLAQVLQAGDVVSLSGDLGAGKTALTRGLAEGLGCLVPVSSPTFTLIMEHPANQDGLPLFHFDVYRLPDADAFLELGLDDYFDRNGICVIEWGNLIESALPEGTMQISLRLTEPDTPLARILTCTWPGHAAQLLQLERSIHDACSGL